MSALLGGTTCGHFLFNKSDMQVFTAHLHDSINIKKKLGAFLQDAPESPLP